MTELTFAMLRGANLARLPGMGHTSVDNWSPNDWATAVAGELGEACNLLKKQRRGEDIPLDDIARELADTQIYLDLLAARLHIDLGRWTAIKFNEVSSRNNLTERLPVSYQAGVLQRR